jgi:hypothetical protein
MRVRTIRKHINGYPPVAEKNPGRKYDVPDDAAGSLIASGVVEADDGAAD